MGERAGESTTGVKLLAAGIAAAALLQCAPAFAGVQFDKKPNVKKVRWLVLSPWHLAKDSSNDSLGETSHAACSVYALHGQVSPCGKL